MQANTRYWLQVDLYPLSTGTNRAEILIEETDSFAATFTSAYYPTGLGSGAQGFPAPRRSVDHAHPRFQ